MLDSGDKRQFYRLATTNFQSGNGFLLEKTQYTKCSIPKGKLSLYRNIRAVRISNLKAIFVKHELFD